MPAVTLLRYGALLLAGLVMGWTVNGWRLDARWHERAATLATATAKASEAAREREQVLADAIAIIDAEQTAQRTKADVENARRRDAVADGSVRLLVRTACPAAGLPQAAPGAGLDHGARAELSPDSRPDYHALREGLTSQERKLTACQGVLDRIEATP